MNGIDRMIKDIVDELKSSPYMVNRQVISGYRSAFADDPLRCDTVAVSLNALEIKEGAFGGYFGTAAAGGEVCGRQAVLELLLTAAVPKRAGGEGSQKLAADIASAVMSSCFGGSVLALKVGKPDYDRGCGGLRLPIVLTLICIVGVGAADSGARYSDIVVKLK